MRAEERDLRGEEEEGQSKLERQQLDPPLKSKYEYV
jgi:hypothetical protein